MQINNLNIITIAEELTKINDKFNAWTDKFTSNSVVASFLTLGIFLIACIGINYFANK